MGTKIHTWKLGLSVMKSSNIYINGFTKSLYSKRWKPDQNDRIAYKFTCLANEKKIVYLIKTHVKGL